MAERVDVTIRGTFGKKEIRGVQTKNLLELMKVYLKKGYSVQVEETQDTCGLCGEVIYGDQKIKDYKDGAVHKFCWEVEQEMQQY